MTATITMQTATAVALHHARAECRLPVTPDTVAQRQHHRDAMCDAIEGSSYPALVLAEVARRLGRHRALQVELPAHAIETAIRQPKIFADRL